MNSDDTFDRFVRWLRGELRVWVMFVIPAAWTLMAVVRFTHGLSGWRMLLAWPVHVAIAVWLIRCAGEKVATSEGGGTACGS